ncbi:MAG: hypothetical protein ACOX8U_11835 [Bradymonadia bacterium]|jgi:hypothetical protein
MVVKNAGFRQEQTNKAKSTDVALDNKVGPKGELSAIDTGRIQSVQVVFRESASASSPNILGSKYLASGTQISLLKEEGNWYYIEALGKRGYIAKTTTATVGGKARTKATATFRSKVSKLT